MQCPIHHDYIFRFYTDLAICIHQQIVCNVARADVESVHYIGQINLGNKIQLPVHHGLLSISTQDQSAVR